jgi:fructokinase
MDIVCLGEVLIDMFPAEIGRRLVEVSAFRPVPGGAPANAAVAAAKLGATSGFIGKVGEDFFGHMLEEVLRAEGVDTRAVRFDPQARTTLVFIAKPDENNNEYIFYRNPGADVLLAADEIDRELLQSTQCLHFGSLSLTDEPIRGTSREAVRLAKSGGALVSFDVNYRPSLWPRGEAAVQQVQAILPEVDLVKLNETELVLLTGGEELESGAQSLLDRGPSLCVITLGEKGSYFQSRAGGKFVPPFQVKTVDATGCGDAFIAGLLIQLVRAGKPLGEFSLEELESALRYANAVGAMTAQTLGVIPALPTAAQVGEFLARQPAEARLE